ncbi:MAG: hypothetical protein DRR42_02730 [Gammaproteobacteria bacterium]|nr:MAG: hypothetical protein DRR42_02730 [Gammaproteobacteria bacterium]
MERLQITKVPWLAMLLLAGCAVLNPARQQPEVHLTSIQPLPRNGLEQRFLIGLNIINPDSGDLRIAGLSYSLWLNGRKVASGVSGELAAIPAYSESAVQLEAGTNLLSGLRFITELLHDPNPSVEYEFKTKIRTAWWPVPKEVIEQGNIELGIL